MKPEELELALGDRIRGLRIRKGLTQAVTAERANVSLGALKHLESGSGATVRTLTRVLIALDQEHWFDGLEPGPDAFNPLDLLAARQRGAPKKRAQRVRVRRDAAGGPDARRPVTCEARER